MSAMPALCSAFRGLMRAPSILATRIPKTPNVFQNVMIKNTFCTKVPPKELTVQEKLMQFFDEKRNWGEQEVQVGRSWKLDELRIKSNSDLHKLWYILLKERNMLLTMETECVRAFELFPNPERIDKVKDSMKNVETVVRERNQAYHLLETGLSGEVSGINTTNEFGLKCFRRFKEHAIPSFMNPKHKPQSVRARNFAISKFLRGYNEKMRRIKYKAMNRDKNHVQHLLKRFPNMDLEKLKQEYPNVNIEKLKYTAKSRGHFLPKEFQ